MLVTLLPLADKLCRVAALKKRSKEINMSKDIKSAAIPNAGYMYQTHHGVNILCDWLENPARYTRVRFECDDSSIAPQGLDDIVAERHDGTYDYWQVKFTVASDTYLLDFNWLLEKKKNGKSNLRKWYEALEKLDPTKINSAQLITNRIPDRKLGYCLYDRKINYDLIEEDVRKRIADELGNDSNAKKFFEKFQFVDSEKRYDYLKFNIFDRLRKHSDNYAIDTLLNRAYDWAVKKDDPYPDGWITLDIVNGILSRKRPVPIQQDFIVPDGYTVPDESFHEEFYGKILNSEQRVFTLTGAPGKGKSTYLSHLCALLEESEVPVVRHHYFLSHTDRTDDRFSSYVVETSLNNQLQKYGGNHEVLGERISEVVSKSDKPLIIILDGLDHIWRENSADMHPLEDILKQLLPAPGNVKIIFGTQQLPEEQIPSRLLQYSPQKEWIELPAMSGDSVLAYVREQHGEGRLRVDEHFALDELAYEISKRTEGYPLLVIYVVERLCDFGREISTYDLLKIGEDLSGDIYSYYESLWVKLTEAQKDALVALCAFNFYWPRGAFFSICQNTNMRREDFTKIEHLTHKSDIGNRPFHNSLVVFVQKKDDYSERLTSLLPYITHWLENEAPIHLNLMWLWLVQAQANNYENIIEKLDRDWILDRLSEGYDPYHIIHMLSVAKKHALQIKKYAEAYRLDHLQHRVENALQFFGEDGYRIQICSLLLSHEDVLKDVACSRLGDAFSESAIMALVFFRRDRVKIAESYGKKSIKLHKENIKYRQEYINETIEDGILLDILGEVISFKKKGYRFTGDDLNTALYHFLRGCLRKRDIEELFYLHSSSEGRINKKLIENVAIRLSYFNERPIYVCPEVNSFNESYLMQCVKYLKNIPSEYSPCEVPEAWLFEDGLKREVFLHDYFFKKVYYFLNDDNREIFSTVGIIDSHKELIEFLKKFDVTASLVAQAWKDGKSVSLSQFYSKLENFKSQRSPMGNYYFRSVCFVLLHIAFDCVFVQNTIFENEKVDFTCLDSLNELPCFYSDNVLREYLDVGIGYNDDIYEFINEYIDKKVGNVQYTSEYATDFINRCELSIIHGEFDDARPFCRKAWQALLGYGYHKDISIIETLEGLEEVRKIYPYEVKTLLSSLNPQIDAISEFTDGDETSHAQVYLNSLLAHLDPQKLVRRYEYFLDKGEWYDAENVLTAWFEGDLSQDYLASLAKCGLPEGALKVLQRREAANEDGAGEILNAALPMSGDFFLDKELRNAHSFLEEKGEEDYSKFSPTNIDSLVDALRSHDRHFNSYEFLPRWYEYWVSQGYEATLLENLEALFASNKKWAELFDVLYDQLFDSVRKSRGANSAFQYAIKTMIKNHGWSSYYEKEEKSLRRLELIARLYPRKADEFIQKSSIKEFPTHSTIVPGIRLVYFLKLLGRTEEAFEIVKQMVHAVIEDTAFIPLSHPSWDLQDAVDLNLNLQMLLAHRRCPLSDIRWRCCQVLSELLPNKDLEKFLLAELSAANLETEAVEILLIFWLAKSRGYCVHGIASSINARSLMSDIFVREISGTDIYMGHDHGLWHMPPNDFIIDEEYVDMLGNFIRKIYDDIANDLARQYRYDFCRQLAFEWSQKRKLFEGKSMQRSIGYYLSSNRKWINFETRASEIGCSAFLRMLSFSVEMFGGFVPEISKYISFASPIYPPLAFIFPNNDVYIRGIIYRYLNEDIDEESVKNVIREIENYLNKKICYISIVRPLSEYKNMKISVERYYLNFREDKIDNEKFIKNAELFLSGIDFYDKIYIPQLETDFDDDQQYIPSTFRLTTKIPYYLHQNFYLKGIHLPANYSDKDKIFFQCNTGKVEVFYDDRKFGEWSYWNTNSYSCFSRQLGPFIAEISWVKREFFSNVLYPNPQDHIFKWEVTIEDSNDFKIFSGAFYEVREFLEPGEEDG